MSSHSRNPLEVWARLTAAARSVRDERDTAPPFGFATRVAALAFAQERRLASLFERFALRALGVACLLALASVALNYRAVTASPAAPLANNAPAEVLLPAADDPVAIVLAFAD